MRWSHSRRRRGEWFGTAAIRRAGLTLTVIVSPFSPHRHRISIIRAYEMLCLNLATHITHYRLRSDGALVLVDRGEVHCVMCYVPESLCLNVLRSHLQSRANSIRKILRDRRIVVEMGHCRSCVYSSETLQRRSVLVAAGEPDNEKGDERASVVS